MESMNVAQILGMTGALVMPVWNIPLIVRIIQRKSSDDISIAWVVGVWVCVMLMVPSSLASKDPVLKMFGIVNAISFSCVFVTVLKYHFKK